MRAFAILACCAATLLTPPARAQDAEAAALIERGLALRERGDDDAALALFTDAWERAPTPQARAQMALAEQALGRWVLAHRHLREALVAEADPWIQRRRAQLVESLREVAAHVGSLEVRGDVVGAEVWLHGARLAQLPMSEPSAVVAGDGVVEVRAAGYISMRRPVTIRAGALTRETFTLEPAPPREAAPAVAAATVTAPSASPPTPIPAPAPARWPAWASLGGAALLLGAATGAWVARESAAADYNNDARCDRDGDGGRSTARDDECPGERTTVQALTGVAIGGAVVGVGLGVVAAILFARGTASAPARAATCGPGPGALGLACAVTF